MVKGIAHDIGRHDYRADALLPFLLDALAVSGVSTDPRLPQARRGDRVQRLLYLNPAPDGAPIFRGHGGRHGA